MYPNQSTYFCFNLIAEGSSLLEPNRIDTIRITDTRFQVETSLILDER